MIAAIKVLGWLKPKLLLVVLCLCSNVLLAKDLGKRQTTFPIDEEDLLMVIQSRAHGFIESGAWDDQKQVLKSKVKKYVTQPPAVKNIKLKVEQPRIFYVTPSVSMSQDIYGPKGKDVLVKKGQVANPLSSMKLEQDILFIDGENERHIQYASQHNVMIVLVNGRPFELMERLGSPVYFDQQGVITKKFKITQVPALVRQVGEQLEVQEFMIDEARS